MTIARRQGGTLNHLVLADSVLVLNRPGGELVISDDRLAIISKALRTSMDALPTGSTEHTTALRSYVDSLASYRNQPGGFWVASTDPEAAGEALTGSALLQDLDEIALLSDGASRLVDRFGLLTWSDLLDLLRHNGPETLLAQTRAAEQDDPEGRRWPRSKTHDDAPAVHSALRACPPMKPDRRRRWRGPVNPALLPS
ncbi:hypothetical protein ACFY4C_18050 [Actinomadura viridis]|uniref:hypothetical protein n=1 Tax=Actinomadura viridis TaxID=58110 RepID=UPI0036813EB7